MTKNALNLGAMTGLIISVIQLILFLLGFGDSSPLQWVIYLIFIFMLYWGGRRYRDTVEEGYISYEKYLGFGFFLSFGTAFVFSFFIYVYAKFVDTAFMSNLYEQTEIALYQQNKPEEEIELTMTLFRTYMGPGMYAAVLAFMYLLCGFAISLINGLIIKRPKPYF